MPRRFVSPNQSRATGKCVCRTTTSDMTTSTVSLRRSTSPPVGSRSKETPREGTRRGERARSWGSLRLVQAKPREVFVEVLQLERPRNFNAGAMDSDDDAVGPVAQLPVGGSPVRIVVRGRRECEDSTQRENGNGDLLPRV